MPTKPMTIAVGGEGGTRNTDDDWLKMLRQFNETNGGQAPAAAKPAAPNWLMTKTEDAPNWGAPVPGMPAASGQGFGGQRQSPYLSPREVFSMIPSFQTPDSHPLSPYYTGVRTTYRDPGMTAAAMNFLNEQEKVRQGGDDMNLRRALGFGQLATEREKNELLKKQIDEKYDPANLQTRHALSFLEQNPNATPAQAVAAIGRFNQAMQAVNPKAAVGGAPAQVGATNAVSVEQERQKRLGPEVYGWLNDRDQAGKPTVSATQALTNIFRHDRTNPGFMQQNGREVLDLMKQNFGENAVQSFMNPGAVPSTMSALAGLFNNGYSDEQQARAAMRHYMGLGKPVSIGGRGIFGLLPGMGPVFNPQQGLPPIPGSPGAGVR